MEPHDGTHEWENLAEEELLRAAVSGEGQRQRDAIEEILRREYHWVKRACFFVVRDPEAGADCVQEALLEIAKSLPRFRGDSALRTWMFVIVRRLSRRRRRSNWLRDKRFPLGRESDAAGRAEEIVLERGPDLQLELKEEERRLWRLVEGLPEKQRLAIVLHYTEDLSVAEVARSLQCSESAVKTHLARAREKLKRRLTAEDGSSERS